MAADVLAQECRRCSRCSLTKTATRENFSFITSKQKWHPWCKPCCAEDRRLDRARRPEHYAEIGKRARAKDPERARAAQRLRYDPEKNRKVVQARTAEQRARYNANRRRRIETDADYAEKVRNRQRMTAERHGHKYAEQRRRAWAEAPASKRLRTYFTSAICHSLKGTTKGGRSWQSILGFSTDQLIAHLERQFRPGMSWDNYGDWHVDHILPVSCFNIRTADDAEFKACWALTNLRPMWAADNIRKRNKRLFLI